jgi:glyoxylase-like metal-dependent hydrolase (beta-lactamase superfamily II)
MRGVLIERSTHPHFLSNTYLVADGRGGPAFFVDAGGPAAPLIAAAEKHGLHPTHVLLTHHHYDHVADLALLRDRWPGLIVLAHPLERELIAAVGADIDADSIHALEPGEELHFGALTVTALATPGHTAGMLSLLVTGAGEKSRVFTGDTLFRGSVGGVRAPGHTTIDDLRASIIETLLALEPETVIEPGHADSTTVARELDENPFVRIWRGLDSEGAEPCTALGEPATLVLLGPDYDGGTKAWVRWADGSDDIVPGSQVTPGA